MLPGHACDCCVTAYVNDERQGPSHWKPVPVTNSERIRAMSDEELIAVFHLEDDCPPTHRTNRLCNAVDSCIECWLKWFQQPVEEDA